MEKHVFDSAEELQNKSAEKIIEIGTKSIEDHNFFSFVLSGGQTPRVIYTLLGSEYSKQLDWTKVHLFWGDERDVIKTHPDSNYGMAKTALLDKISIPESNVHRIGTEEDLMLAAQQCEDDIKEFFSLADGEFPKFDLILLGVGDDGHTASLFPDTDAIHEKNFLVMDNFVKKLGKHRVTFTFPTINNANNVMFIASGPTKSDILKRIFSGEDLPAVRVKPTHGNLLWFLDQPAAKHI